VEMSPRPWSLRQVGRLMQAGCSQEGVVAGSSSMVGKGWKGGEMVRDMLGRLRRLLIEEIMVSCWGSKKDALEGRLLMQVG
jgi:hypothetical protein